MGVDRYRFASADDSERLYCACMPTAQTDADRVLQRWERRTDVPLAAFAVIFLVAYALPILDQQLPGSLDRTCRLVNYAVWAVFAVDYATRLGLARRWRYFWTHLHDLAMVALPVLRPLRLLRLVMLLRVLNRRAVTDLHGRVITYVAGSSVILIFCASLAELDAERNHPGATIHTFGDALWWAVSTVTTVGYGDRYPVTAEGRIIASGLMLGGIAIIGVVTATIASSLIDRVREISDAEQAATRADIEALGRQLASHGARDVATGLAQVAELHQTGLLSADEFTKAKTLLLG